VIALFITLLFGSHKRKIVSLIQKTRILKKSLWYNLPIETASSQLNCIILSVTEEKQDEQSCIKFMRLFYLAFRNFDFDKIK